MDTKKGIPNELQYFAFIQTTVNRTWPLVCWNLKEIVPKIRRYFFGVFIERKRII